ncbi:hypothetical protein EMN47_20020 [Prolixibacteraceae bacterium JC049]|nr:hypothetical protein [Prolixibacteraceae bacterium JC049]
MNRVVMFVLLGIMVYTGCKTVKEVESVKVTDHISNGITYNSHIKDILFDNCLACHSGKHPSAGMSLEGYDNVVRAVKNRGLLKRINNANDPMPVDGLMPEKDRKTIELWVKNNLEKGKAQTALKKPEVAPIITGDPVIPVNIEKKGFEFMEKMPGHWVGSIDLLGQHMEWFAFDFRAINTSQVHGLFEGGSMGNLFNTFFVAEFRGVKTIMLRNGGVLNGIYRTSYFVLTEANNNEYLFVDAQGGKKIMWVKVAFQTNRMKMTVYTSKLGKREATKHMEFDGKRMHTDLAKQAAEWFKYPTKTVVKSFPKGMPNPTPNKPFITASYIMQWNGTDDYETLGRWAKDPIQMKDLDNIAQLKLMFKRNDLSKGKKISIYLSKEPLTDNNGKMIMEHDYIRMYEMNQVVLFPEIEATEFSFNLTYLHPGWYYITCVVDNDGNLTPSKGDAYTPSVAVEVKEGSKGEFRVESINKTI